MLHIADQLVKRSSLLYGVFNQIIHRIIPCRRSPTLILFSKHQKGCKTPSIHPSIHQMRQMLHVKDEKRKNQDNSTPEPTVKSNSTSSDGLINVGNSRQNTD